MYRVSIVIQELPTSTRIMKPDLGPTLDLAVRAGSEIDAIERALRILNTEHSQLMAERIVVVPAGDEEEEEEEAEDDAIAIKPRSRR